MRSIEEVEVVNLQNALEALTEVEVLSYIGILIVVSRATKF